MSARVAVIRMINENQYLTVDKNGRLVANTLDSLLELFNSNDYVILDSPTKIFLGSNFMFEFILNKIESIGDMSLFRKLIIYNVGYSLSWTNRVCPDDTNFSIPEVNRIVRNFLDNIVNEVAKSQWYIMFCLSYSRMFRLGLNEKVKLFNHLEKARNEYLLGEHTLRSNHIYVVGMGGYLSCSGDHLSIAIDNSTLDGYYVNKDKFQYLRVRIDSSESNSVIELICDIVRKLNYNITPMRLAKDNGNYIVDFMVQGYNTIERVYQEWSSEEFHISPLNFDFYMIN